MSKQTMGEFLALLRKANGFTQQDVADKLNISNRTLSSWETDRTTPDILLLPTIADLYGVTVDELLRCERNAAGSERKEISDEAKNSARKHRLGKFSAKCLLLSCLGCFGAVLLSLSFIFWMYTDCPTWLFILLIVLSACDVVVCGIIHFYGYYNAKVAEGLVVKSDYTEDKKAYALALKRKSANYFLFCAVPLLLFAVAMTIATLIIHPVNVEILGVTINVVGPYIAAIVSTACLGILFLLAYVIYSFANFKRVITVKQTVIHKNNAKLAGKIYGFGTIPIAISLVLMLTFIFVYPTTYYAWLGTDTKEEFKKQIQTLTIDEYDSFHTECGKAVGEYYLNFPENYKENTVYDLGNGFCGIHNYNGWKVLALKDANRLPVIDDFGFLDDYDLIYDIQIVCQDYGDFDIYFVNVAKNYTIYNETVFGVRVESELRTRYHKGKYEFGSYNEVNLSLPFISLFCIVTGITVITCTAIYLTKRKKQNFET